MRPQSLVRVAALVTRPGRGGSARDARGVLTVLSVVAYTVVQALALSVAAGVMVFVDHDRHPSNRFQADNSGIYVLLAMLAGAVLIAPLVVLCAAAARMGALRRARRLSIVRLLGGSPAEVRTIGVIEAFGHALVGVVGGTVVYLATLPLWSPLHFEGQALSAAAMWIGPLGLGLVSLRRAGDRHCLGRDRPAARGDLPAGCRAAHGRPRAEEGPADRSAGDRRGLGRGRPADQRHRLRGGRRIHRARPGGAARGGRLRGAVAGAVAGQCNGIAGQQCGLADCRAADRRRTEGHLAGRGCVVDGELPRLLHRHAAAVRQRFGLRPGHGRAAGRHAPGRAFDAVHRLPAHGGVVGTQPGRQDPGPHRGRPHPVGRRGPARPADGDPSPGSARPGGRRHRDARPGRIGLPVPVHRTPDHAASRHADHAAGYARRWHWAGICGTGVLQSVADPVVA
ncbi:Hypothetical membrane protein [Propionibacterium freudenreichii subsp. freudenreichii]|uniref:Hypothetical membrane protein n=1 Tax=Propionibacterium freudenreichii subsp. freudenreichii TaxID=66712 RepID=A0A068VTZ8_PROFF|nr:Putative uncharacterized protein [Propionibacterium freudenreichii subsp. freudenreichii]CEG95761.1 Hypothetical membrane protein [Propionibacterium freudenreichii]CEP27439.1 Hypothetical membrane protein [Propionibacterium freudenreichii subsp. freudenreichii]